MKQYQIPRIMLAAAGSGSGKTTILCGLLAAWKKHGYRVCAAKCGPDYIDSMFHKQVVQAPSTNLDLFFSRADTMRYLLGEHGTGQDVMVIEGVMGLYDGMQMDSAAGSSYDIAKQTQTPIVLVVNGKGMGLSIVAVIKGMLEFHKDAPIKGVIINGVSPATAKAQAEVIEKVLPVQVFGSFPMQEQYALQSRHLGLVTPFEIQKLQEKIQQMADTAEQTLDLAGLLQLAQQAPPLTGNPPKVLEQESYAQSGKQLTIGVAKDAAFCFYYKDNLRLLEQLGCELVVFQPLRDKALPRGVHGLLLGGGYPEVYAAELSANHSMRDNIFQAVKAGMPCMAECGGFMYLLEEMEDEQGQVYPMAGVLPGSSANQKKLVRFGYASLTPQQENPYLKPGEELRVHEFHYWDSANNGAAFLAQKPSKKRSWSCMHAQAGLLAGYPHLYYYSQPQVICRWLMQCRKWKERNGDIGW